MTAQKLSKKDYMSEWIVGMVFLGAILILFYYTVLLNKSTFSSDKNKITAIFDSIDSLSKGDTVRFKGVNIGYVDEIRISQDGNRVLVYMLIDKNVSIHDDYTLEIAPSSVLGGSQVSIQQGMNGVPLKDTNNLKGTVKPTVMDGASELIQDLKKNDVIGKIDEIVVNVKSFTERLNKAEGTLSKLIDDTKLYDEALAAVDSLKDAGDSITKAGDKATEFLDETKAVVTDVKSDVKEALANLKNFTDQLDSKDSSIGRLLNDDGEVYDSLKSTLANAEKVTTDLNTIVADAKNGSGTLGKLINDDSLYISAKETIDEAKGMLEDMRETSPISTFGGFIFGAL